MKTIGIIFISLLFTTCSINKEVREPFTADLGSPQIPLGTIEVQFAGTLSFGRLRTENIDVIYFPLEDAVCLRYRHDYMTYHQFWDRAGRAFFIQALETYKTDFEQRNLGTGGNRSKRRYGTIEGFLIWQMFTFTVQARGNSLYDIGYFFRERSPFFTVNQRETYYVDPVSRQNNRISNAITLYFTIAQADSLAALFNQELLRSLSPRRDEVVTPPAEFDVF